MSDIYAKTSSALASLNLPYAARTYQPASGNDWPDLFLVYNLVSDVPAQHADNDEWLSRQRVQVTIWKRGNLNDLPDIVTAMKAAGFRRSATRELPFDAATGHFGLATDFILLSDEVKL